MSVSYLNFRHLKVRSQAVEESSDKSYKTKSMKMKAGFQVTGSTASDDAVGTGLYATTVESEITLKKMRDEHLWEISELEVNIIRKDKTVLSYLYSEDNYLASELLDFLKEIQKPQFN